MSAPFEAFVGRLADLRGPRLPSRIIPTHVIVDVTKVWQKKRHGGQRQWCITAYSLKDASKITFVRDGIWLSSRCI